MKKDKTISFATAKEKFFVYGKNRKEGEIMENEMKNQEKQENELALKTENKSQRKKRNNHASGERTKRQPKRTRKLALEKKEKEQGTIEPKENANRKGKANLTRTKSKEMKAKKEKNDQLEFHFKKPNLKIIPLGGLDEIGKNITVFEYEDEIVLVDCGLEFPEDSMLGVDLVIPDVTYLERNKEKIKGLVITHGHEDHIGSIPYVLRKINMPIYATKLTNALIRNKLEEHKLLKSTKLIDVQQGETISFGKIKVEFIRSSHSIPDAVMLAIHTPVGVVLHTGDFKVDFTPIDGEVMDLGRIAELGNQGVLALMSDSTNSERTGYTMSERSVGDVLDKQFINCTKRIVVATFASMSTEFNKL